MFVDASAIVAFISEEREADSIADALTAASSRITAPVAVLKVALALAHPDKFNLSVEVAEALICDLLDQRDIEIRDLPPANEATRLMLSAAHRYRAGRWGLNLADCLHYACAKYYNVPILATDGEFGLTDLETVK